MELFKIRKDIPFMKHALIFNAISFITFALAVFFLVTRGLHLSVEFTGGTVMEVAYEQPADLESVRKVIESLGYTEVPVQNFGTSRDVLLRLPVQAGKSSGQQSEAVLAALKAQIAERLEAEYKGAARAVMKRSLLDQLDGMVQFDLPANLVEAEANQIAHQLYHEEHPDDHGHNHGAIETTDEHKKLAVRRVRLGLLLAEIGRKAEVTVTDAEMTQAVLAAARQYPGQERQFFEFVQKNAQMQQQLRADVLLRLLMVDPSIDGSKRWVRTDGTAFVQLEAGLPAFANVATGFASLAPGGDIAKHLIKSFGGFGGVGLAVQCAARAVQQRLQSHDVVGPGRPCLRFERDALRSPVSRPLKQSIQARGRCDRHPCLLKLGIATRQQRRQRFA